MNQQLLDRLFTALCKIPILDPHSHINPHQPVASSLDDLIGYHYYTELAHSSGMSHAPLDSAFDSLERTRIILQYAQKYENTVQWSWFVELCQTFFGWKGDRILGSDADCLWKCAQEKCGRSDWTEEVWKTTQLEKVFLTNDFDDPLTGFDTSRYVPCLRTDDLVFKLLEQRVQERLAHASGIDVHNANTIGQALDQLFVHFVKHGARACAVSLPPDFTPDCVSAQELDAAFAKQQKDVIARGVFWMIAERCRQHRLPFDLMIGVNRRVYQHGVYQGQDLYDQRTSLIQYSNLFNSFPEVIFCVSVLTSTQNQELTSYSWIFPNVLTCGHWWYSNVPSLIERDLTVRLQSTPSVKQIGYYSDAYKLEFILPKFNMYRRSLARVLAGDYVVARHWSEERAIDLGTQLLRTNVFDRFLN